MTRRRGAYARISAQLSRQQTRPEPEPTPEPMNLTASATMTLHSAYIDALARQAPDNLVAMLQLGGGINADNAAEWLGAGASHVIATSFLFDKEGRFQPGHLDRLLAETGRERLVIDLSCRRRDGGWIVAMNRWQTLTDLAVTPETLDALAESCDEFLIHAADVEGKCQGIDGDLVRMLGSWGGIPMTYAGGASSFADLELVDRLGGGKVDLTIGSALDLFGGDGVRYEDCVAWNRGAGHSDH